ARGSLVLPLRLVVDHDKPLVKVEISGLIVAREVFDHFNQLELGNALAYPKLIDARRMQVGFTADDVMQFAACIKGLGAVEVLGPMAVVSTADEATYMLSSYINLSESQRPAKLFDNVGDALNWLDLQQLPTYGGSARILVVDDNHGVLREAVEQLTSLGYDVVSATNGADALALIQRDDDIDLLFTDVVMPGKLP